MDETYIRNVLNGDTNAFRFLIKSYKDIAFSLTMSVVKNEFLAEEVLQTAFVIAFTKLSTFKGKSKFSTWLYRIVVNEAFKVLKKQKNENMRFGDQTEIRTPEIDSFSSVFDLDEQRFFINEALKMIVPKESLVLRLFYLEENSIEEIVEITGWTSSHIKVLLHRARINMKAHLSQTFDIDKQILYPC